MRRDVAGGKRGNGNERTRRIRRADPARIQVGAPDPSLSSVGGLVAFGACMRRIGVDARLRESFADLKKSRAVVYPMETQMRLLIDAYVAGEQRVFGLESLAADPVFVHLAGGVVPSVDTVYRDLTRFDAEHLAVLDTYVAEHAREVVAPMRLKEAHLDIDTTVEPLFGEHEGGLPGYNPRYPGRNSYHPVLARIAEGDMCLGAQLRPGNTTFGADDVAYVKVLLDRARLAVGPNCVLYTRIDGAADCTAIMRCVQDSGSFFLTKARMTADLMSQVMVHESWTTVDVDANDEPVRQVAEIKFAREEWTKVGLQPRVIAVRSTERDNGKQIHLWEGLDYTVQVFLTDDAHSDADDLARRYDKRAGIEPLIAELKGSFGIDKVPSQSFDANHAALLLKVLSYNLLRRYVRWAAPALTKWRAPWIRRTMILVPARLLRSGRRRSLRLAPRPALVAMLN